MTDTLYEHCFYLVKETKKPTYLDFYDLEDKDLKSIECYLEQTVRINNKWYFVTTGKKYFRSEADRENAPKYYIKALYQKPIALTIEKEEKK